MASDSSFCANYMVSKPEELDFFDLFHILFSGDLEKRKFVECSEKVEEGFGRRLIIFVSILVLRFLQSVAKPMSRIGSAIEFFLNLLSSNRNLSVLLLIFLRG
ncbi:hypothetical protein Patl1_28687 [Pistacia atlantica]|uniref:Uncharacterized protein n=1 Tax=Pistacia atlantica TaxID=434234 RepID=A0ACC1BFK9_9ROSI|nr:hypothetical protein Patl1_28687 [Pistacia atlantica]